MWCSWLPTLTAGSVLLRWLFIALSLLHSCPEGWGDAMPENVQDSVLAISYIQGAFQAGGR